MTMINPLAKVRGLGSAKEGVHHWVVQRMTAVANIPLILFFIVTVIANAGGDHASVSAYLGNPLVAIAMLLLIGSGFCLARGFQETGLDAVLGGLLGPWIEGKPLWLVVGAVVGLCRVRANPAAAARLGTSSLRSSRDT